MISEMSKSPLLRADVYTTVDGAELLGVTPARLRQLHQAGIITPAGKVGGAFVWSRSDLVELLELRDAAGLRTPTRRQWRGRRREAVSA